MIADLNKIQLGSSFFAKIICREKAIDNLRDGTIYVLTGNRSEWNEAVMKMQESIKTSKVRSLWRLPYNMQDFVDIYNTIYNGDGIEQYNRLVGNVEEKDGAGFERKRLTDCYKIIANCVNIHCSFFNESPSPYITNYDKPLTIDADLIEISDKFMNQDRIKKLFEDR